MMQYEFEELAGYKVSRADYEGIIEPMYSATPLSKADFVKTLSRKRFEYKPAPIEKPVFVSDGTVTPNRCYYIGRWYMQIGAPEADIKTGKVVFKVRETTPEEQRQIGWDPWLAYNIDINTFSHPLYTIKVVSAK